MEHYLRERSSLSNRGSEFSCPESCDRHGCREPNLHISITVIDLIAIASVSGRRPLAVFREDVKIGFDPIRENEPWMGRVNMELKKSCRFLDGKWCSVYPRRPLACGLFPEYFFLTNQWKTLLEKEIFQKFPCLRSPCSVSPARKEALDRMMELSIQETFLSDFYLFGVSPFLLDLKNIIGERLEGIDATKEGKTRIPYERIEGLVAQKFLNSGHLEEWEKKIEALDETSAIGNLIEMKNGTDRLAKNNDVGPRIGIAHQFDGARLLAIHLP